MRLFGWFRRRPAPPEPTPMRWPPPNADIRADSGTPYSNFGDPSFPSTPYVAHQVFGAEYRRYEGGFWFRRIPGQMWEPTHRDHVPTDVVLAILHETRSRASDKPLSPTPAPTRADVAAARPSPAAQRQRRRTDDSSSSSSSSSIDYGSSSSSFSDSSSSSSDTSSSSDSSSSSDFSGGGGDFGGGGSSGSW